MSTTTSRPARILGDIGGTNARFAWQETDDAPLQDIVAIPTTDHPSLSAALGKYLRDTGHETPPWCAIGIANPVNGDEVKMTNGAWSFSISMVQKELGFERLVVLNDFTALALAIPALPADKLYQFGGGDAIEGAAIGLIGPGTGLGVSGLIPNRGSDGWTPLQAEGGHATLAATTLRETNVLDLLRARFGHVSAERAVSGQGLEAVYLAICELDGVVNAEPRIAEDISARALAGSDPQCVETLDLFCGFLGNVAGNLALTIGARGGVYIGGGIVPRLGDAFKTSRFRATFEDKGRFRAYMEAIPVFVIDSEVSPALLGASRAL